MAAPYPPPRSTRPSYRAKPLFWKGPNEPESDVRLGKTGSDLNRPPCPVYPLSVHARQRIVLLACFGSFLTPTYASRGHAGAISLFALEGRCRRRGSQGRVFTTGSEAEHRVHSGNPTFRRPSISSFEFVCPPRAIHVEIVKAGSSSNTRAAASRASASRPRWASAAVGQR